MDTTNGSEARDFADEQKKETVIEMIDREAAIPGYRTINGGWPLFISPEDAAIMLGRMPRNRSIKLYNVQRWQKALNAGKVTCATSIVFDEDGNCVDGQHRLHAVITSGKGMYSKVDVNYPKADVKFIDTGVGRSVWDGMMMDGEVPDDLARKGVNSVINAYANAKIGRSASGALTRDQISRFVIEHQDNLREALSASSAGTNHALCNVAGVQAGLFSALECGVSKESVEEFCLTVNKRYIDSKNKTAAVRLIDLRDKMKMGGRNPIDFTMATTECALRDYVARVPRSRAYSNPKHVYTDSDDAPMI